MDKSEEKALSVALANLLEKSGKIFLTAGLPPETYIADIATFLGYIIGNGSSSSPEMTKSLKAVEELIEFVAKDVFIRKQSQFEGGTA